MIRNVVSSIILLAAALQLGCGSEQAAPSVTADGPSPPTAIQSPTRNPKIPVEVSYPIVSDEEEYNSFIKKRVIKVKLNQRVSADVLRAIALELKSQENRQYERTFISYFLPDSPPNAPEVPWATSHFNPTLQVEILGLGGEDEKSLKSLPITRGDGLLGSWIIDHQYASHRATIYREGDAFKLEELYPGGDRAEIELTEVPTTKGQKFKKKGSIDQYKIDTNRVLRIYGQGNKLFAAAWPMK